MFRRLKFSSSDRRDPLVLGLLLEFCSDGMVVVGGFLDTGFLLRGTVPILRWFFEVVGLLSCALMCSDDC